MIESTSLAALLFHFLTGMVPPGKFDLAATQDWAREPRADVERRFASISEVIEKVALDPNEAPVFMGKNGRSKTALLMMVIGVGETRFARDTHLGYQGTDRCYGGPGSEKRCDSGKSACPFQINVGTGRTAEGWTRADLFQDFEKCARAALHRIRQSVAAARRCGLHSTTDWLNAYASGFCDKASDIGGPRVAKAIDLSGRVKTWKVGLPVVTPTMLAALAHAKSSTLATAAAAPATVKAEPRTVGGSCGFLGFEDGWTGAGRSSSLGCLP